MKTRTPASIPRIVALASAIAFFPGVTCLQAAPPAGQKPSTVPVQITVTLLSQRSPESGPQSTSDAPLVAINDVQILEGKDRRPVLSWIPAQGTQAGLQLLILIDDSDRWSLSTQFDDLRAFILAQPPTTTVGVGYMYSGMTEIAQNFTVDHDAAAKALRPPLGRAMAGSVYFSLADMYKRRLWRFGSQYPRRAILLLSDGNDPYSGSTNADAFVEEAISDMHALGIQIFGLCIPYGANGGYNGGSLLEQVSQASGGVALYTGLLGMPFFKPLLAQFNTELKNQYLLTFAARPEESNTLRSIKVKIEKRKVKFVAPDGAFIPGG